MARAIQKNQQILKNVSFVLLWFIKLRPTSFKFVTMFFLKFPKAIFTR